MSENKKIPITQAKSSLHSSSKRMRTSKRIQAEEQVRAQTVRLKILADASKAFAAAGSDYQAVLDQVVRQVVETLADMCQMRLLSDDGQLLKLVGICSHDLEFSQALRKISPSMSERVDDPGLAPYVIRTGKPAFVPVITFDQLHASLPPEYEGIDPRFAPHSFIVVPLRVQGRSIGILALTRYRVELPAFTEEDVTLALDLADRAAVAMNSAWLYEQLQSELNERKQAEKQILQMKRLYATLSQVNQTIVRVKEQNELYQSICDVAVQFGEFALAWVGLLDEASGDVKPVTATGLDITQWPFKIVNIHTDVSRGGLVATALRTSKVITSEDIEEDKRTRATNEQFSKYDYQSSAAVPFRLAGKTVGMLSLVSSEAGLFNAQEEVSLLEEIGLVISFALDRLEIEAERKKADDALKESEQQYRELFETSPVAIYLAEVICDAEGEPNDLRFLYVNPVFERFVRTKAADIVGHTAWELFPQGNRATIERQGRVALTGISDFLDGFSVPLNAYFDITVYSPRHGQCVTFLADITKRKQAEEALKKSESDFRLLAEAMPQIVWTTRADGWNTYFNQRWVDYTGLTLEESYGHGWNKPFHPGDQQRAWDAWENATKNNGTYSIECRLRRADGIYTWWLIRGVPVLDADGNILKWFGTCTNIDEMKRAEQEIKELNERLEQKVIDRTAQLEAANKELEAFSYSVSHDLRAPLRAINGYTNILMEDYAGALDAEGQRVCNVIISEAQRMGMLIDNLLSFSRLSRTEMHTSRIDMQALVRAIFDELTPPESRARIDLHLDNLQPARGDMALIRQVWINLLSNALKFTSRKEKAIIEVESTQNKNEVIYTVRDNGAGFDMQYANKLFGVFQRLHNNSEFVGTGVGLAIVQRVINRHGGRVWAEGKVDQGAAFFFTLPGNEAQNE